MKATASAQTAAARRRRSARQPVRTPATPPTDEQTVARSGRLTVELGGEATAGEPAARARRPPRRPSPSVLKGSSTAGPAAGGRHQAVGPAEEDSTEATHGQEGERAQGANRSGSHIKKAEGAGSSSVAPR